MNGLTRFYTLSLFLVLCFLSMGDASALPQVTSALPVIREEDGDIVNEDDCQESAQRFPDSCAVIYEKKECDTPDFFGTGDEMGIAEGTTGLLGTGFHDDVESIIVRPGCVLHGYERSPTGKKERGISVSAVNKADWVYRELDDEDDDLADSIEAVDCYCGADATKATEVLPFEEKFFKGVPEECNMWIYVFNGIPVEDRPCAILYEADDCETGLTNWYKKIQPSSNITNLSFAKGNSAESVLVRPGCTFIGYDQNDGNGAKVTVAAPKTKTKQATFLEFNEGTKEIIGSFKCTCA